MPLILRLAAPGSPCRLLFPTTRLLPCSTGLHRIVPISVSYCRDYSSRCVPQNCSHDSIFQRPSRDVLPPQRQYSSASEPPKAADDLLASIPAWDQDQPKKSPPRVYQRFQLSIAQRKAQRKSQPAIVLDSIHSSARNLYSSVAISHPTKVDYSYTNPRQRKTGGKLRNLHARPPVRHLALERGQISLYTILAGYLEATTTSPWAESEFQFSCEQRRFLESEGYETHDVRQWATSLLAKKSSQAATLFEIPMHTPPFFLLLLFLRRKCMKAAALGVVLRHTQRRLKGEHIAWGQLKTLVIRLLRHVRTLWPEAMPKVASIFCLEATRIYDEHVSKGSCSPRLLSEMAYFTNSLLSLLSLPVTDRPILSAAYQENAQFTILQFMASRDPPFVVTKAGFRSVIKNQLAHAKTPQEQEWANLKGPSWPPWKENKTAMDEDKGYEFGASRASRILHRMHEGGYAGGIWEEVAQLYAGWDSDLSPTIQSRSILPKMSAYSSRPPKHGALQWAGRVRTTRTRREAWACFLACEASGISSFEEVYLAMFEKLHYPEIEELQTDIQHTSTDAIIYPGDVKETFPDPRSPLHLVYLTEPVPTYEELYHRMNSHGIRASGRLLTFLMDTLPRLPMVVNLLDSVKDHFEGGVEALLDGSYAMYTNVEVPDYFFASFIRFLCRFGYLSRRPPTTPIRVSAEDHRHRLQQDKQYLVEYAHALLLRRLPYNRPAWTAFMDKLLFSNFEFDHHQHKRTRTISQYRIMCELFEHMYKMDLGIDDEQFRLMCIAVRHAAGLAFRKELSESDTHHILTTSPTVLRSLFHELVGANADPSAPALAQEEKPIPPHVPSPAELHMYVRALGMLRDYEGLYSFSTWITVYHAEVTARAHAQHSGPKALYRTLVALRAAMEGLLQEGGDCAPGDLKELVKAQIESVEEWGGWPPQEQLDRYVKGLMRASTKSI